jgi:hypothetical protein
MYVLCLSFYIFDLFLVLPLATMYTFLVCFSVLYDLVIHVLHKTKPTIHLHGGMSND